MSGEYKVRNLAQLRESASTARILNLLRVRERHGETDDYAQKPLFQNSRLNQAIFIKHTIRANERDLVKSEQQTATKVVFALDHGDLGLGGFSFFIEQRNLQSALDEALGSDAESADFERDLAVLKEFARLPSLDPYLLRERVKQAGSDVASCYFDISEADLARVEAYVEEEIGSLVELAYGIAGPEAKAISSKLAQLIMRNEQSSSLEPLRQTLRLDPQEYEQGIFGWKGLLYYKWNISDLEPKVRQTANRMVSTRFIRAHAEDEKQLDLTRKAILRTVAEKYKSVQRSMRAYDQAFDALVNKQDPGAFRNFLLRAPSLFVAIGEDLAAINHICSFWDFRLPAKLPNRLEVDDAYDIYHEFAAALGGHYQSLAA